jgi:hypothetical protein
MHCRVRFHDKLHAPKQPSVQLRDRVRFLMCQQPLPRRPSWEPIEIIWLGFLAGAVPDWDKFLGPSPSRETPQFGFWCVGNRCHAKTPPQSGTGSQLGRRFLPYKLSRFLLRAPQPGTFLAGVPSWGQVLAGTCSWLGAQHIRPETIVVFRSDGSSIGAPFQMGFENFRPAVTETHISLEIRIGRKTCIDILPDKGSICRRCTGCNTTSTVLGFAS